MNLDRFVSLYTAVAYPNTISKNYCSSAAPKMPPRVQLDIMADLGQTRSHHIAISKRNDPGCCIVDPETGCWLFSGSVNSSGYGQACPRLPSPLATHWLMYKTGFHQKERRLTPPREVSSNRLPAPRSVIRRLPRSQPLASDAH